MLDGFGREIDYLRVSVTDRCDLRCVYCMPERGVPSVSHEAILRYEEILRLVRVMARLGVRHVRVTGGEPMLRRDCLSFVRALGRVAGVESVSMTSNGLLLSDRLDALRELGLSSLNLSLDTLDPAAYARITRGGDVRRVLRTLDGALDLGIPVKLNAVPVRGFNEDAVVPLAELARERPLRVRFIELMPLGAAKALRSVPQAELTAALEGAFGPMVPDPVQYGHGPARYWKPEGFTGSIGLIGAVSREFCESCNRVRLTADGRLKLCLNHSSGPDLRALLRGGADDAALEAAIRAAVAEKPERHCFSGGAADPEGRSMNEIGG